MIPRPLIPASVLIAAMVVAGLTFGLSYFSLLRRSVCLYGAGHRRLFPVALTLARLAAAAIFLSFAARLGAPSLLAAFLGFLAARAVALRGTHGAM